MFYKIKMGVIFFLILCSTGFGAFAEPENKAPVSYTIESPDTLKAGDRFNIAVVFDIEPGWYVYAPIEMNIAEGKIPTNVDYELPEGIGKTGSLKLPDGDEFFDIYHGEGIRMSQEFHVDKNMKPGSYGIKAKIVYQTCNDDICYPPVRKMVDLLVTVKE